MYKTPIQNNPHYDTQSLRILLPSSELQKLPQKEITKKQLIDIMKTWEYNPIRYYKNKVKPFLHEVGHDLQYRYTVT